MDPSEEALLHRLYAGETEALHELTRRFDQP